MSSEHKGRVLIVEDDLLLSMVEERLIKKLGFDVIGKIDNGSEAIKKAEELEPDIIVMDISLKGEMDGIETMQVIRENSSVPVIYLSGSGDRYSYERAKKTNFIEFLTKPVTSGELKPSLFAALDHKNGSNNSDSSARQFHKTA